VIRADGWDEYSIWEHSQTVKDLYARRCRLEAEEMTCAAQAAEILAEHVAPGDTLLDAGCGSGYFFHSLRRRGLDVDYTGIDAAKSLIEIGRRLMPAHGLPAAKLQQLRIEDLAGEVDHVVCMNVLSNIDNYHRPLERLLRMARKCVVLRESCADQAHYSYVRDRFLDDGVDLSVYVNTYPRAELLDFIAKRGFEARCVKDRYTGGAVELVIGHPHHWEFVVAVRR
jgi:SAM-dependent methyltransferase